MSDIGYLLKPVFVTETLREPNRFRQALRLAWLVCGLVVIIGSLLPDTSPPMRALDSLGIADKIQHFAAYAVLAFLPAVDERPRVAVMIAIGLIGLGAILELGQLLVGRHCEVGDLIADTAGICAGIATGSLARCRLRRAGEY